MAFDKKFKTIMNIERALYDQDGMPLNKLDAENFIFLKMMNLNFMNYDKL